MNNTIRDLLRAYSEGTISKDDMVELERLVGEGIVELDEIEALAPINQLLSEHITTHHEIPLTLKPSVKLEKNNADSIIRSIKPFLKVAASICLLALAFVFGQRTGGSSQDLAQIEGELFDLKEMMMLNLLEQDNSSSRLKAVSLTQGLEKINEPIVAALLNRVKHDPSDNVRIACIEALIPYTDRAQVREGLANSVAHQKSPLVLLSLAEALQAGGQSFSLDSIKQILPEELPPSLVKDFEDGLKIFM